MLTSHEILARTGIKNIKTLTRWHQRGLIPPPEIGLHPSGRGKVGMWPAWVVERALRIRQLLREGYSLDEVRAELGSDWVAVERQAQRGKYRPQAATETLAYLECRRQFAAAISEKFDRLLTKLASRSPQRSARLDAFLLAEKTGHNLLTLLRDGYNPVLVHAGADWQLVPDFVVALMLADECACLVVPVFAEAVTAFSPIADNLPAAPVLKIAPRAVKKEGRKNVEYVVRASGKKKFALVDGGT